MVGGGKTVSLVSITEPQVLNNGKAQARGSGIDPWSVCSPADSLLTAGPERPTTCRLGCRRACTRRGVVDAVYIFRLGATQCNTHV